MSPEAIGATIVGVYVVGVPVNIGAFFAIFGVPPLAVILAVFWPVSWLVYFGNWIAA